MKYTKISGWGLLSLLAALSFAPLSAYAHDREGSTRTAPGASAPIARTKPVIDQAHRQKQVAHRHHHEVRHHHGAHAQHQS